MALGARRATVLLLILRKAGWLVVVGEVVGVIAFLTGAQLLKSLIFGIAPRDPLTLILASLLLLVTALIAAWRPAWRAAAIEPLQALRTE
jgi:ABC-type antimicrobial peptide transport system permease subunit